MATYQEAYEAALEYYNGDDLPAKTFVDKYALRDLEGDFKETTPPDMHKRLAKELYRVEKNYKNPRKYEEILESLLDFKYFVPQGSPMFGIGNPYTLVSLSNCFVVESPQDDMSSIMEQGKDLANIMKRRGGVGVDLSHLRPEGANVRNAARTSTGAWSFADLYSFICRMIGQDGRRGALMITLDVRHPDVFKFATMKRDKKKVTGANVSIKLNDRFMRAVRDDTNFTLQWPIDSSSPKVKESIRARDLWEIIIDSVHDGAEPGLLMWDNILRELPAQRYSDQGFSHVSTNPCGEIPLSPEDACRLLAMNLTGFVKNKFQDDAEFDFDLFIEKVRLAQRMMDNIVDLELECVQKILDKVEDPSERGLWEKIYKRGQDGRRTGLGTFGLGDTLAQLGLRYDSDEALEAIDSIYKTLRDASYEESVNMSIERGPFPVWDWEKERSCNFIKRLPAPLRRQIEQHGRRNISNLTNAPTGSVSIESFNTSSGIEPVFRNYYTRRKKINHGDENSKVDFIDELGDRWQEFNVFHKNVADWIKMNHPDWDGHTVPDLPNFFVSSDEINWKNRVRLQGTVQKYVDHSISSCLTGNTLVHTEDGFVEIKNLVSGKKEGFHNHKDKVKVINIDGNITESSQGYYNGFKEVKKVTIEDGSEIVSTPNHRLMVLNENYFMGWKYVSDIVPGDIIVERIGLDKWSNSGYNSIYKIMGETWNYSRKANSKEINIPVRINKNIARLLGYLTSDGSLNDNGVTLSQVKNNVCEDFKNIITEEFSIENFSVCRDERADSELYSISVNSRELRRWFEWLGIRRDCREKIVPKVILQAGRRQVVEYIKGLTLDGHTNKNGLIPMTSSSLKLLQQVQTLLKNFGILSRIIVANKEGTLREFPGGNVYKTSDSWCIWLNKLNSQLFMDYVGFAEERKEQEYISKFKRPSRKICPGALPDFGLRKKVRQELLPSVKSSYLYDYIHSASGKSKQGLWLSREFLDVLDDLGYNPVPDYCRDKTYNFYKVKSVENCGVAETFDISVPETNSYLAGSLISHNTINLPAETTKETVGELYLKAWEEGLKGVTIYRDGSRSGVLVTNKGKDSKGRPKEVKRTHAPKRPPVLPCDVYHGKVQGEPWTIIVGLMHGEPYELFGGPNKDAGVPKSVKNGFMKKTNVSKHKNIYDLVYTHYNDEVTVGDIGNIFNNKTYGTFTRTLSLALRHGAPVQHIVEQLGKDDSEELTSLSSVLRRALKRYIKDGSIVSGAKEGCEKCGSKNLAYQEGCPVCLDCSYTKCK